MYMDQELQKHLNKLFFIKRKFYFNLLAAFIILYAIIIYVSESWQTIAGIGIFGTVLCLFIFVFESMRKKDGLAQVQRLYEPLTLEEKTEFLEQFRTASKKQWEVGFFSIPSIAIFVNGDGIRAIQPSQILWAYKNMHTLIPMCRTYSVDICTMNKERITCDIGSSPLWSGRDHDDAASNMIWNLCRYYPGIISGYSIDIKRKYWDDFEALKDIYREREQLKKQG